MSAYRRRPASRAGTSPRERVLGLLAEQLLSVSHRPSPPEPNLELGQVRASLDSLASFSVERNASAVEHLQEGDDLAILEPLLKPLFAPLRDVLPGEIALVLVLAALHQLLQSS